MNRETRICILGSLALLLPFCCIMFGIYNSLQYDKNIKDIHRYTIDIKLPDGKDSYTLVDVKEMDDD